MKESLTDMKLSKGYTLVEVLVVVAIMGILSAMGVAGLQGAVQNNRIKDAGLNVAAYMERASNEANRLSETVCVAIGYDLRSLRLFEGACDPSKIEQRNNTTGVIDVLTLDSPSSFVMSPLAEGCDNNLLITRSGNAASEGAAFTPKLGLSAVPTGCFVMRYGETEKYAAAVKSSTKNTVVVKLSYDGGKTWSDL